MKKLNHILIYGKPIIGPMAKIGIIAVILVSLAGLMVWNTFGLNAVLDRNTKQYVKDVSYQLANDISTHLQAYKTTLKQLADSVSMLSDDVEEEFLKRKEEIIDFDALVIINRSGTICPENFNIAGLKDSSGIEASFQGETTVVYIENQNLLFSTPIYVNGKIEKVLAGLCAKETIQSLIQPKSFDGNGLSCIIDRGGKVVISPTDLNPFLELDHIFKNEMETQTKNDIIKMKEDMAQGKNGVYSFITIRHEEIILSYHSLEMGGWVLLTLVPADLISSETNHYVVRTFIIVGGVVLAFVLFLISIAWSFKSNRKKLEKIAFTDSLTGGMNNVAFQLEYRKLAQNMRPFTHTVILLDLKGFKLINENFGVGAGNDTLRYIYNILKRNIATGELMARSAADHFFLCLKETDQEKVQLRIDTMIKDVNSFNQHAEIPYYLSFKQGACLVDDPSLNITIIQDRARAACKMQGNITQCVFYSSDLTEKMKVEQEMNNLFDGSIANHDFHVFLQPKIQLADDTLNGAEALVRWIHPQKGMILPSDFIPALEKSGNICKLDLYVFEEVCILLRKWIDAGKKPLPISVNVSRIHFKDMSFLSLFSEIKGKYGIPDGLIELELTESIFLDTPQIAFVKNAIKHMHKYGLLCSLDDFGVGFSSLGLLKEFDVDAVKLDKQFFVDIENQKAQYVISSFIALSKKLGIHTVAEGIENQQQLDYLRKAGCDMVQGYIFSKPLSIPDFEKWAQEREN